MNDKPDRPEIGHFVFTLTPDQAEVLLEAISEKLGKGDTTKNEFDHLVDVAGILGHGISTVYPASREKLIEDFSDDQGLRYVLRKSIERFDTEA